MTSLDAQIAWLEAQPEWAGEPESDFSIPAAVIAGIQTELGLELTQKEVLFLTRTARDAIAYRRTALKGPSLRALQEKAIATDKRRAKIVKCVLQLKGLLASDEHAEIEWRLSAGMMGMNSLGTWPWDMRNQTLDFIQSLAEKRHPLSDSSRKRLGCRPVPDREAWGGMILAFISILDVRGIPFTANHQQKKRAYTSPLMRALELLHNAMPADVQAVSATALGSAVHAMAKTINRRKKVASSAHRGKSRVVPDDFSPNSQKNGTVIYAPSCRVQQRRAKQCHQSPTLPSRNSRSSPTRSSVFQKPLTSRG